MLHRVHDFATAHGRAVPVACAAILLSALRLAGQSDVAYEPATLGTRVLEGDGGFSIKMLVEEANLGGEEVEIFYVLSGTLDHVVDGEAHRLTPGMVGIVRPGDEVIHRVVGDEPARALVVWAPGGEIGRFDSSFRERPIGDPAGESVGEASSASAGPSADGFDPEVFDAYVSAAVEAWDAPGLAVAVVKDGEVLFEKGYGVLEVGAPERVDEHTRFAIGSTTKAMTAAALGMLVDERKLAWDDHVIERLPGFQLKDPYVTRELTIRDLLTHRAGLGNADFLWYEQNTTQDEILRKIRYVDPAYSFRSSFIYQNIMFLAAGKVIEEVSGMSWADFVRTHIFEPLGMDETLALGSETEGQPNVAVPHDYIDGELVAIENASVEPVAPAGAVWSSVHDMSKWLRFLLAGGVTADGTRLLRESTVREFFTPQVVQRSQYPTDRLTSPNFMTYGFGWFQKDYRGHKVDYHTGSIDGMVAIAGLIRDQNLGVYVLGNRDHVELRHALMYRVFDRFNGHGEPRDWSAELKKLYDGFAEAGERARASRLEKHQGGDDAFPRSRRLHRHVLRSPVRRGRDHAGRRRAQVHVRPRSGGAARALGLRHVHGALRRALAGGEPRDVPARRGRFGVVGRDGWRFVRTVPMKTLLILRHAKSSWEDAGVRDHDRALNPRGVHSAPRMGRLMIEEDLVPEKIISSSATRARSTAELVAGVLPADLEIETTRELYLASPHTYLDVIADLAGDADPVLVVGHNPAVTALVTLLTDVCEEMPTAALAAVELDLDDWADIGRLHHGRLLGFWRPRELD